jgi:proteasome lid subunit RPN8/RPN11
MHCLYKNRYRLPIIGIDLPLAGLYVAENTDWPLRHPISPVQRLTRLQWLNPGDPLEKRLPLATAIDIANHLLETPDREQGLIITNDFQLVPFANGSRQQPVLVEMKPNLDFDKLTSLAAAGLVWGWAHSHVVCDPTPSLIDIRHHQFSFNMVIFSCADLTFSIHTTEEISALY